MPASKARLQDLQRRQRELVGQLLDLGFVQQGSVVRRHTYCATPGCRCHADPPQPHGPYWQWTRYQSGKTVTRRLSQSQAALYQEWIDNRRRLAAIVTEIEKLGEEAAELLLQQRTGSPRAAGGST